MENKKERDIFDGQDDFWNLDLMLPQNKKTDRIKRMYDTETAILEIKGDAEKEKTETIPQRKENTLKSDEEKHKSYNEWLNEREEYRKRQSLIGKQTVREYAPDNPLIRKVTVSRDIRHICTKERFISDAERLFSEEGGFKGNIPLVSYYPQYSLLNEDQLECYIGFRSAVRAGEYPYVDAPYIYLYLYEIINLQFRISPEQMADDIIKLINAYPDCDDRLFTDMCNWLTDICLIYGINISLDVFGDNLERVRSCAAVKEIFFRFDRTPNSEWIYFMTASGYDYQKSRYYKQYKSYYDKIIPESVGHTLKNMSKNDSRYSAKNTEYCTLIRESFFGALCTSAVKYTIALECLCITRADTVKKTVTDIVKYSENCLRRTLGIKARLTVNYLSSDKKMLIKDFFSANVKGIERKEKNIKQAEVPDYEKLYEPKEKGISFRSAEQIEKASWRITERLVEDVAQEEETEEEQPITDTTGESDILISGLNLLFIGNGLGFAELAKSNNKFPAALADEINDLVFNFVGDNVIENQGDGYCIVDDYTEDVEAFLKEKGIL